MDCGSELTKFDRGWLAVMEQTPFVRLITGLVGLTRLGERPAPLDLLARVVGLSAAETTALAQENFVMRIEDGTIHWDEPFPGNHIRRTLHIGDREIPMRSGCAPDLFSYAAVLDVPFRVEDTCATTGAPIRIDFVPDGYESVNPPEVVAALLPLGQVRKVTGGSFEQINTTVCTYQPFFASPQAAQPWLAAHPGGRVFPVQEMFQRAWLTYYRDTLRPLIHN